MYTQIAHTKGSWNWFSMVHLRSIVFLSILAVANGPTLNAQNSHEKKQGPQRSHDPSLTPAVNPEVRSLLDDSEALPPEFASDVSLTLLENGFVRDEAVKAKVITRAFEKASAAQDDVMRRPFGASVEETSQGLHAIASSVTGLNRISLQARVIRQVVASDPRRARQLLESTQLPQLTPVPCNENWYFVPDAYYDALAAVLKQGFSSREIADGNRAAYVSSIIRQTQSHVQLVPIARLLTSGDFTEQELRTIIPAYAAVFAEVHGDPLSFSILMSAADSIFEPITALLTSLDRRKVGSRALLQAFRDYMVVSFKGSSCGALDPSNDSKSLLPTAIVQFNETFQSRLNAINLRVIRKNEIKSDATGSGPDEAPSSRWNSQAYFQWLASVQKLNTRLTKKELAEARPENDARWLSQAQDVLTGLSAWSNEGEPEVDFFHQKALLLEGLAKRTIGTSLHSEVLDAFVRFLEQNSYQDVSPIDWFFCTQLLLKTNAAPNSANSDLRRLVDSREPVLSVYARLQSLLRSAKQTRGSKHSTKSTSNTAN
jgi:hypothetical protein